MNIKMLTGSKFTNQIDIPHLTCHFEGKDAENLKWILTGLHCMECIAAL